MYGASPDIKILVKTFADFPNTPRVPIKNNFSEQNMKYLPVPFTSEADM